MLTGRVGCGPLFCRYWSGINTRPGGAVVVSNGVGNWFPSAAKPRRKSSASRSAARPAPPDLRFLALAQRNED